MRQQQNCGVLGKSVAAAVSALAGVLVLGACTSSVGGTGDASGTWTIGYVSEPADPAAAIDGGTLTFGSYSFPRSLDPLETQISGSTGGTELAAIYDVLVRRDSGSEEYVPQLAESFDASEDGMLWRVVLPEQLTFSDGSPLDAAAVRWSMERFSGSYASGVQTWNHLVESVTVADDRTVEIRLTRPWQDFPSQLATGPGMIVAQSAEAGERFVPVGAGPFTVRRFAVNEELALDAREDYSGGRPHLDGVRFVPSQGSQMQFDSLRSGQLDMTYLLRDPAVIEQIEAAGWPGYRDTQGQGAIAFINQRAGRPGEDVRVRQAIALAVDPEVINQRATQGKGEASAEIFPTTSKWHSAVEPLPVNPKLARDLLAEAKAEGYDGKLTYVTVAEPSAQAAALATQAMLGAVGFEVTIDYTNSVTDLVRRLYADHDFDIARGGLNLIDDAPYLRLYDGLGSDSGDNASGYANLVMDGLLEDLLVAQSDEERQEIIDQIQRQVNETLPYLVWGPAQVRVVWTEQVHGVDRTVDNILLLDDAWKSK